MPDCAATRTLNGYIRHETVSSDSQKREQGTSHKENDTIGPNGFSEEHDTDSEGDSEDEVFRRSAAGGRPLLNGKASSKRVRFSKVSERAKRMTLNDLDDELGPQIRKGRTWRRRCSFLSYCLLANLTGMSLALLLWNLASRGLPFGASKAVSPPSSVAVCPRLSVGYLANRTTNDQEDVRPLDGNSKLIPLGKGNWLFVLPFGKLLVNLRCQLPLLIDISVSHLTVRTYCMLPRKLWFHEMCLDVFRTEIVVCGRIQLFNVRNFEFAPFLECRTITVVQVDE